MTPAAQPAEVDTELLELAEIVLRQSGYTVERLPIDGVSCLLGEDQDNVIVLAAVVEIEDIFNVEPLLSRLLSSRLTGAAAEAKKWDGYAIVITSARPEDSMTAELNALTQNLNQVRRLIRIGVDTTRADVERSVRAVLPLSPVTDGAGLLDPLAALEQRLVADGLDAAEVAAAIAAFRAAAAAEPPVDLQEPGIEREAGEDLGPDPHTAEADDE
jgi:hypothetical protein